MTLDSFDYQQMVQDALRGVVRRALMHVAEHGLPGVHHFYITFDTARRGVVLAPELLQKYPDQITVVLQHDYRNLEVEEDRFSVVLHFGGLPQRIVVPFRALLAFYDPTEQFVLRFELDDDEDEPLDPADGPVLVGEAPVGSLRRPVRAVLAAADRLQAVKEASEPRDPEEDEDGIPSAAPLADGVSGPASKRKKAGGGDSENRSSPERTDPERTDPVDREKGDSDPNDADPVAGKVDGKKDASEDSESPKKPGNVVSIDAFRRK